MIVSDDKNQKMFCDFWRGFVVVVMVLGGYFFFGEVVLQNFVRVEGDVSWNYVGGNVGE